MRKAAKARARAIRRDERDTRRYRRIERRHRIGWIAKSFKWLQK